MPIDPRILQAIMSQTRSQASPSPMGPQGTGAGQNALGTTGIPANPMGVQPASYIRNLPGVTPQTQPDTSFNPPIPPMNPWSMSGEPNWISNMLEKYLGRQYAK